MASSGASLRRRQERQPGSYSAGEPDTLGRSDAEDFNDR
jgi:hypothetical protein